MKPNMGLWASLTAAALCTGCVEQRYVISSDPAGAAVYRDGNLIGYTPVDDTFVYYGKYHFTLVKDGYETLQVDQSMDYPIYEFPGLDFVSEVLYPFNLRDVHRFSYQMRELQLPGKDEVLNRGQQLRDRGKHLLEQNPPVPRAPASVAAPVPSLGAPAPTGTSFAPVTPETTLPPAPPR